MFDTRVFCAAALLLQAAVGAAPAAVGQPIDRTGRFAFTQADLMRIEEETGVSARGGMVRIVECEGAYGYSTIQSAIDASSDGDVVVVLPNDCNTEGRWFEHVDFLGKSIKLQSANPEIQQIVDTTIIDGQDEGTTIRVSNSNPSENQMTELDGLTIKGGDYGIRVTNSMFSLSRTHIHEASVGLLTTSQQNPPLQISAWQCIFSFNNHAMKSNGLNVSISQCVFENNTATSLEVLDCQNAKIWDNEFRNNDAADWPYSSAINIDSIEAIIDRCNFLNNSGDTCGGVYACGSQEMQLSNCSFVGNSSSNGYAGAFKDACGGSLVQGCTFVGNSGRRSGAVYAHHNSTKIETCVLILNRSTLQPQLSSQIWKLLNNVHYSLVENLPSTYPSTNIDADPVFVDPGHWDDNGTPADLTDDSFIPGDYHLLPGSPCIDAGDPAFVPAEGESDLDGNPRVVGCYVDMGAFESPVPRAAGDFNGDTVIDLLDVSFFVDALLTGQRDCLADVNDDGVADGRDIAAFVVELL